MDEFAYTVLIPPGQNPCLVNVGWVGSHFKISKPASVSGSNPFPVDPDFNVTQLSQPAKPTTAATSSTGKQGENAAGETASQGETKSETSETAGSGTENILNFAEVRQVAVCLLHDDLTLKVRFLL